MWFGSMAKRIMVAGGVSNHNLARRQWAATGPMSAISRHRDRHRSQFGSAPRSSTTGTRRQPMAEGSAVLERLPHSRRLRRTVRLVEILGIAALRKAVEAVIARLRHLVVAHPVAAEAAHLTVAVDPTAEANIVSRDPSALR